jgi:hypothetical protein
MRVISRKYSFEIANAKREIRSENCTVRLGATRHRIKKAEFHWVSVLGLRAEGFVCFVVSVCVCVFWVV